MTFRILKAVILVSLIGGISRPDAAFGQSPSPAPTPRKIEFRTFVVEPLTQPISSPLGYVSKKAFTPLALTTGFISKEVYQYTGKEQFILQTETGQPLASQAIPSEGTSFLLLVENGESPPGSAPVSIQWIESDASRIPPGSYLLFNRSGRTLGLDIDGNRFRLGPQEEHLVTLNHREKTNIVARFVEVTAQGERPVANLAWLFNPDRRTLVYIYPKSHQNARLGIRAIVDYSEAPTAVEN